MATSRHGPLQGLSTVAVQYSVGGYFKPVTVEASDLGRTGHCVDVRLCLATQGTMHRPLHPDAHLLSTHLTVCLCVLQLVACICAATTRCTTAL